MVVPVSYHDDWLIESLANYSALLLLEHKKGSRALDTVLEEYRNHLLSKVAQRPIARIGWSHRVGLPSGILLGSRCLAYRHL